MSCKVEVPPGGTRTSILPSAPVRPDCTIAPAMRIWNSRPSMPRTSPLGKPGERWKRIGTEGGKFKVLNAGEPLTNLEMTRLTGLVLIDRTSPSSGPGWHHPARQFRVPPHGVEKL